MRFAIQVCDEQRDLKQLFQFNLILAEILYYTGRIRAAHAIGEANIQLAEDQHDYEKLLEASSVTISVMLDFGEVQAAALRLESIAQRIQEASIPDTPANQAQSVLIPLQLALLHAIIYRRLGRPLHEVMACANEAVGWAQSDPALTRSLVAETYRVRGLTRWVNGDYNAAIQDYQVAHDLHDQDGDMFYKALALGNLALAYWSMGALDAAEQAETQCIQVARQIRAHWLLTREVGNLGLIHIFRGNLPEALRCIDEQFLFSQRLHIDSEVARARGNRGIARLLMGELSEAREDLEFDVAASHANQNLEGEACALVNLALCYAALGLPLDADNALQRTFSIATDQGQATALEILALRARSELESDPRRKVASLLQAVAIAAYRDRKVDTAGCYLALAAIESNADRQAHRMLAVEILKAIKADGWLAQVENGHTPLLPLII